MNRTAAIATAVIGVAAIAGVTACQSNSSTSAASPPAAASTIPTSVQDPLGYSCAALDSNGYCANDDPSAAASATAPATPAASAMSTAQQQAVDAAQEYLSDGEGFSAESLLQQLASSDGNGFTRSDAEFAINYLHPNWDAQAVDAAKSYLSDGEGFSRSSLIQQLTSDDGNGFTQAQAEYAASKVGL